MARSNALARRKIRYWQPVCRPFFFMQKSKKAAGCLQPEIA
jgi:hypothetical protein